MQVEFTPIPGVCYAFDYPKLFSDIRSGELSKEEVRSLYRRLCREDSFFLLYFVLHYTTANHPFVVQCCKDADQDGNEDWIIDLWARGHFKALALDTPVPTPTGFKLHGDLAPGDTIYGGDGLPTQVVAKTEVFHNADCFEVTLSDGYVFTCSGQHLWKVNIPSRARLSGNKRAEWKTEVINTSSLKKEVDKSINTKTRKYPTIDVVPLKGGKYYQLPCSPYVLGLWLGDGTSSGNTITTGAIDREELTYLIELEGHKVTKRNAESSHDTLVIDVGTRGVGGSAHFTNSLRQLGVLDNKHIPGFFMDTTYETRLSLLQGLMDTDGSCHSKHGQCVFCSASERLALDTYILCQTIGLNPTISPRYGMYKGEPRLFYQVIFNGHKDKPVFRLSRKLNNLITPQYPTRRRVESVQLVPSVPVSCIQVSNKDGMYLTGLNYTPTHNSSILTVVGSIKRILNDPEERIGILSHTRPAAKGFLRNIKQILETNTFLIQNFPDILFSKPQTEAPKWSEDDGLYVKRAGYYNEATIEAWGLVEGMPTGKHFTYRIYDDIETKDLVSNKDVIDKLKDAFAISQNLKSLGGKHRIVGTPYSHLGLLQDLRSRKQPNGSLVYHTRVKPATEDGTPNGRPVLLSQQELDNLKCDEAAFNSQQLLNPTPVTSIKLDSSCIVEVAAPQLPHDLLLFMIVDQAGDLNSSKNPGDGDDWAIEVWGVEPRSDDLGMSKIFLTDAFYSPMGEGEAIDQIVRMYMRAGIIQVLGVEKVGISTTHIHIQNALSKKHRHVSEDAKNFVLLRPAGRNKKKFIESAIAWPLHNGKIHVSTSIPEAYRHRLHTEMDMHPFWKDDALNGLAYLYDILKDDQYRYNYSYGQSSEALTPPELGIV